MLSLNKLESERTSRSRFWRWPTQLRLKPGRGRAGVLAAADGESRDRADENCSVICMTRRDGGGGEGGDGRSVARSVGLTALTSRNRHTAAQKDPLPPSLPPSLRPPTRPPTRRVVVAPAARGDVGGAAGALRPPPAHVGWEEEGEEGASVGKNCIERDAIDCRLGRVSTHAAMP